MLQAVQNQLASVSHKVCCHCSVKWGFGEKSAGSTLVCAAFVTEQFPTQEESSATWLPGTCGGAWAALASKAFHRDSPMGFTGLVPNQPQTIIFDAKSLKQDWF